MVTTIHTHDDDTNDVPELFPHTPDEHLTKYVYFDEDGLHIGTLRDYAKAWEHAHYHGYYLSSEVRTWYGSYPVTITRIGVDDNDYLHYRLTANDETVFAVIDGRA